MICRVIGVCLLLMALIVGSTLCAHGGEIRVATSAVPRVDLFEAPKPLATGLRIDLFVAPEKPVTAKAEPLVIYVENAPPEIPCHYCRKAERERTAIHGVAFRAVATLSKPPDYPRRIWPVYMWTDRNGKWWHSTGWTSAKSFVGKVNNTPVARLISISE